MKNMLRNFRPQPRSTFSYCQQNIQLTSVTNFRIEQPSNDYISSLCKQKLYKEALEAFDFLQKNTSCQIKPSTYACLICACSSVRSLWQGRKIHDHILKSNCQPDIVLQNHILNMYGKCGSSKDARKVFNDMPLKNVVSYTSVIAAYSQNGQEDDAIKLYLKMLKSGLIPDEFTFGSIIKACSGMNDLGLGRQLHVHIIKSEFGSHLIAQNALITMYTRFNQVTDACDVFYHIVKKDLISWGSMIAGFSQLGYEFEALSHFKEMLCEGEFQPNEYIFGSAFSACSSLQNLEYGRQIHGMCTKFSLGRDLFAGCSLCDMYARCGLLDSARSVFYEIERLDIVSWNAIISALANDGDVSEAMSFFSQLRHLDFIPDEVTLKSFLCACTNPLTLPQGRQVHTYIIKAGFESNVSVCNSLLTMYSRCSDLCNAFIVFEEMKKNADSVSWNAILAACLLHNQSSEVSRVFKRMLASQCKPDAITLGSVLRAGAELSSLEMGNQINCYTLKTGLVLDVFIMNGLIDMYAKCGSLGYARELFDSMENPDVVSWSSLIVGYAQFGYGEEALTLFQKMRSLGMHPNQVTFLGVLTACSHVGLVEEGWQLYNIMEAEYGIMLTREHCSSVVDLLARAGHLNEAEEFINQMAFDPDVVVWKTLLSACKTHGNIDIAKRAAENILKLDPCNSSAHILLCNAYASSESWEDVARLRSMMKHGDVKKVPGQSWIEVKDRVHVFFAEDIMHPERNKIYTVLEELWIQMVDDDCVSFLK